jgi:hypothetical protein
MIASLRTLLVVGAALTGLGLGCSRSQSAPQPMTSSGTAGATSPSDERAASDEPGMTASGETLDETGLPLPRGTTLVASGTVDDLQVFPAHGKPRAGTRIVAGGVGVAAVDHIYETPMSYADAVAFYDRILELAKESPYSLDGGAARRTTQGGSTEWALPDDNGNPERVEVSGTTPTRISIAHGVQTAAVETSSAGRANAQPGTSLGGATYDAGRSAPPSSERNGE